MFQYGEYLKLSHTSIRPWPSSWRWRSESVLLFYTSENAPSIQAGNYMKWPAPYLDILLKSGSAVGHHAELANTCWAGFGWWDHVCFMFYDILKYTDRLTFLWPKTYTLMNVLHIKLFFVPGILWFWEIHFLPLCSLDGIRVILSNPF